MTDRITTRGAAEVLAGEFGTMAGHALALATACRALLTDETSPDLRTAYRSLWETANRIHREAEQGVDAAAGLGEVR